MPAGNLIDGRAISRQLLEELAERVKALEKRGIKPGLAFVRVGEDPASKVYVGRKEQACHQLGMHSETQVMPEATREEDLLKLLARLNADPQIHGILVQAPLPRHIRSEAVYSSILPEKDVDGFHPVNMGRLLLGDSGGFQP